MPGPPPKDPAVRRRANKASTAADLPAPDSPELTGRKAPPLNAELIGLKRGRVTPQVRAWWASIWTSPMSSRWLASDLHGLYVIAGLRQHFYKAMADGKGVAALAAEIGRQEARFGLTPIDRRRLDWRITAPVEASEENVIRLVPAERQPLAESDPRLALHSER